MFTQQSRCHSYLWSVQCFSYSVSHRIKDGLLGLHEAEDPLPLPLQENRAKIARCLVKEGHSITKVGVLKFLRHYTETCLISRKPGTGQASKVTPTIREIIEKQMGKDNETTGKELTGILEAEGIKASMSSVLCWRKDLGWSSKGTSYCQMIRDVNKEKRLKWAQKNKAMTFENVVYTDETTVQIETHRQTCSYKRGCKPRYKPKTKHPLKVLVWAGISCRGRTGLCIFEGRMNAPLFVSILRASLLPFLRDIYPDSHRFVQDNAPKHCSKLVRKFYKEEGISWMPTAPE